MVRLVFRPYTQVRRSICTLESLRPPPEFPLASPYSGIVHHLSGPNIYAHTQIFHPEGSWSVDSAPCASHLSPSHLYFNCAPGFDTRALAYMLDSLVRVSRRVEERHFVSSLAPQSARGTEGRQTGAPAEAAFPHQDEASRTCWQQTTYPNLAPPLAPSASLSAISGTI